MKFDSSIGYKGDIIKKDDKGNKIILYKSEPIIYNEEEDMFHRYSDYVKYVVPPIFEEDKYSYGELDELLKKAKDTFVPYGNDGDIYVDIDTICEFNSKRKGKK